MAVCAKFINLSLHCCDALLNRQYLRKWLLSHFYDWTHYCEMIHADIPHNYLSIDILGVAHIILPIEVSLILRPSVLSCDSSACEMWRVGPVVDF